MSDVPKEITVGVDGTTLPVVELLTGRGFVTGKSGSGKSNTASVLCEELLELNLPLLIVDTDGEYYGLKERYEVLHVGADTSVTSKSVQDKLKPSPASPSRSTCPWCWTCRATSPARRATS
jgi:hypothetical protein